MNNRKECFLENSQSVRDHNQSYTNSSQNDRERKVLIFKSILITIALTTITVNCYMGYGLPSTNVGCMYDSSHVLTERINNYLHKNSQIRNLILIFSSLLVDFIMIAMCSFWVVKSRTWRGFIAITLFYLVRGITQALFQMRYPDGYLWDYPGFPSLFVSYLKTNDFFYSGHVGLPIIIACEFFKTERKKLAYVAIFCCLVEFTVMIIMRGHYIIDLLFGVIMGHYIFMLVDQNIHIVDKSFIGLYEYKMERNEGITETFECAEFKPVRNAEDKI